MIKKYLLIVSVCFANQFYAQNKTDKIPDTLRSKNYDYLFERIEDLEKNRNKQSLYLRYFLFKAKSEKNAEEIVNGYKNYVYYSSDNLKLTTTFFRASDISDNFPE